MLDFDSRINVLFVIIQMEMGGAERLVYNLTAKLDRTVFNPAIAWFSEGNALNMFEGLNIPLYYVPKTQRLDFSTMLALAKIIRTHNIQIVNAHHFMPFIYSFYGCKIANRAKLLYTEHSEWDLREIPSRWLIIGRYLLRYADAAIGVSPTISRRIRHTFNTRASQTFTIVNGVDGEAVMSSGRRATVRRRLGISEQDMIIGTVANFRRIKNHVFLLQAFREVVRSGQPVKLLLVGQGFRNDPENSEQDIQSYIDANGLTGYVHNLGYRADIADLLSVMDVFCLTSFREGLPISLIEAMTAGLPVVGTDVEGIRDVITPNTNGFLVQLGDVEGLKKILIWLLQDKAMRQELGHASKILAGARYSLRCVVNEYETLFKQVVTT